MASADVGMGGRMRSLLFAAVLLLAACGAVESTKLDVVPITTTAFSFQDDRPAEDRHSAVINSIGGKSTMLADDTINPPGPALLQTWLSRKLDKPLAGKTVALRVFSVQIYEAPTSSWTDNRSAYQAAQSSTASVPGSNPLTQAIGMGLAGLVINGFKSANADKYVWVKISGTVDGVEFAGSGNATFHGHVGEADVNGVITKALDDTADQIEKNLAPTSNSTDTAAR